MPYTLEDFKIGDRIELHPATDLWMRGDRFGEVVKIGRSYVHVRMDKTAQTITVAPHNLTLLESSESVSAADSKRFTVHLAPSGFVIVDGRSAGVVESGYHARYKAQQRCDELNATDTEV